MHTGTSVCLFDTDIHETYKQTFLSYKVECKGFFRVLLHIKMCPYLLTRFMIYEIAIIETENCVCEDMNDVPMQHLS